MAKVTSPLMSLTASGSVGGLTFSTNAPINGSQPVTVKANNRLTIRNQRHTVTATPAQLTHRVRVREIAALWRTITPAQRIIWDSRQLFVNLPQRAVMNPITAQFNPALRVSCAHGYAVFLRECLAQNITPPDLPMVPFT